MGEIRSGPQKLVLGSEDLAELLGVHPTRVTTEARRRAEAGQPYGRRLGKGWVYARWVVFEEQRPAAAFEGLPGLLGTSQAAELLGVKSITVSYAVKHGRLPSRPAPRRRKIPLGDLLHWLEAPETEPEAVGDSPAETE